jgi:rhodanese-related sulfurtransferase
MDIPTVTADQLPRPLAKSIQIVDVREPTEWVHGHIEGAIHLPLGELMARLDEVPTGQTLVVCKVGGRSAQAVAWLMQQGRDAVNLDGGLVEWVTAQRPLVSETGAPAQIV